jgi:hypothetical protein
MSSAAIADGVPRMLALYRAVLRCHRRALPPPLKSLGDNYFRAELRRHLDPKAKTTPRQWREFGEQWSAYVSALSGRADADETAGDVPPLHSAAALEQGGGLTKEQQEQLDLLKAAARDLGGGRGDGSGGDGGANR